MEKKAYIKGWNVGLSQQGVGWGVSTFKVKGKKVITKKRVDNVRTRALANKEFTKQKRMLQGKKPIMRKASSRKKKLNIFGF